MQKLNLKFLLYLNRRIDKIDEKIVDIRVRITSPRSQVIDNMPKCHSAENFIENGIADIQELKEKKLYILDLITTEWLICERAFGDCNISHEQVEIMRSRYFYGLSWRKCVKYMEKSYPQDEWNENKLFRLHRQVVSICTKNGYEIC